MIKVVLKEGYDGLQYHVLHTVSDVTTFHQGALVGFTTISMYQLSPHVSSSEQSLIIFVLLL